MARALDAVSATQEGAGAGALADLLREGQNWKQPTRTPMPSQP
jgi:hypothetical protein